MAQNKIQIKRSTANATVTGLSNGELAFTQAGNVFFIGAPDGTSGSIRIGGLMVPGTLTANQALVANATSGIDKVITANLAANTIWANGSAGSAGDVLYSNGSMAYWKAPSPGVTGSDTQVQFNDGGVLGADAGFTFAKATDTLTVNGAFVTPGTGTGTGGTIQNTTVIFVGNNTINTAITSAGLAVNGTATIANSTGVYTGIVNGSTISVGTAFTANSTLVNTAAINVTGQVNTATLYATTSANIASAVQANATGVYTTGTVNAASHTVGTSTIANSTGVYTGVVNGSTISVGTSFTANSTVVNAVSYYAGTLLVANTTVINATHLAGKTEGSLNVNSALTANNSTNFGGQLPAYYTNASNITTGTLPWAQAPTGTVNTSGSFTLAGNNTFGGTNTVITSNLTVSGANVNISGSNVNITANTNFGGTNTTISSNVVLTGATLTGTATDISVRNGTFSGNLVVQGSVVTVNTAQLTVNDNIIQLAYTQTTADVVDAGWVSVAGNATSIWYSGFARIAASSNSTAPVFRLFVSNTNPNTAATIDTSANTKTGYLQAYLAPYGIGGALIANATNISVTGNSTVAVAIAANTLSLSTALPGTSGGTGLSSIANNSLIFGNSTNGFNTLALGTAGYVVQSNGTAIVYDTLDGGTF